VSARQADASDRRLAGPDATLQAQLLNEAAAGRVVVIVGPTGIGKSQVAFELAEKLGGEIVVADSRQVYRMLDIATNKPPDEYRRRVRYHMIDFVDPSASFNAADYVQGARAAIDAILGRGHVPVVEGGTMLYVEALTEGLTLAGVPPNRELRSELERLDAAALRERLVALDPESGVDLRNPVRMIRAIEVLEAAGPPLRRLRTREAPPWTFVRVGLTASLEVVDKRLEQRSRRQVERGLVAETQAALDDGVAPTAPVLTGIGYAEALAHIRGEVSLADLPSVMAASNRRYARRQLRWWKRDPRIRWFEIEPNPLAAILKYVEND
jgi:tRNA dimethylallyltransferase